MDVARKLLACVQCHGDSLTGVAPSIPGLLGLSRDYVSSQLGAWQTGLRRAQSPDCMADIALQLTPEDASAVAAWLASRPVPQDSRPAPAFKERPLLRCGGVDADAASPMAMKRQQ